MVTGTLGVPVGTLVVGLVVWKRKPAGTPPGSAIAQAVAVTGPALMIAANAVTALPTVVARALGAIAATIAVDPAATVSDTVRDWLPSPLVVVVKLMVAL